VDANGYRSDLARELGPDARERLIRYAQVWTTSDPDSPSAPSTERQLDLSRMLLEELHGLGLEAELSDAGIVYGTLPGNTDAPTIGLVAHVDTSPDVSGENVKPQIFR
jgi:tripeptide aminopeptidase